MDNENTTEDTLVNFSKDEKVTNKALFVRFAECLDSLNKRLSEIEKLMGKSFDFSEQLANSMKIIPSEIEKLNERITKLEGKIL